MTNQVLSRDSLTRLQREERRCQCRRVCAVLSFLKFNVRSLCLFSFHTGAKRWPCLVVFYRYCLGWNLYLCQITEELRVNKNRPVKHIWNWPSLCRKKAHFLYFNILCKVFNYSFSFEQNEMQIRRRHTESQTFFFLKSLPSLLSKGFTPSVWSCCIVSESS